MELVWTSDLHFGLKTDGIDRNEEIFNVTLDVVKYACKLSKSGKDTRMVFGGDIFNTNQPSEDQIYLFTKILAYLHKYGVKTYVLAGNHDAVFSRQRLSCLSFVKNIGHISENIELVQDITCIKAKDTDLGPVFFTFLPHISRAHISEKHKSPQDYVNKKTEAILKKMGKTANHYVFSHLNVKGAHAGSEESLLKKSEVYVPECLSEGMADLPAIIQGHIHTPAIMGNINIVGSPIFCTFGEDTEIEKSFLHITIPEMFGEKEQWRSLPTSCTTFKQIELDLSDVDWKSNDFFDLPQIKSFLKLEKNKKYHLKFDLTVNAHDCFLNFDNIRAKIENDFVKVKPIVPKYVRQRITRSKEQKIGMNAVDSVKVFFKTNKPKRAKERFLLAKQYMGST